MAVVRADVGCCGPEAGLGEGEEGFAGVPEFDEGGGRGWVGGDVD